MAPKKRTEEVKGTGVNFNTVTRAKLDLIGAGLDRPIGWVVRDAVGAYLMAFDRDKFNIFRHRFPKLSAALDEALKASGGDNDEVFGPIDDGLVASNDSKSGSEGPKSDSK
jgi:hypothetical protein